MHHSLPLLEYHLLLWGVRAAALRMILLRAIPLLLQALLRVLERAARSRREEVVAVFPLLAAQTAKLMVALVQLAALPARLVLVVRAYLLFSHCRKSMVSH